IAAGASGLTLVEVMIALLVLSLGILALARVVPAGSRSETEARLQTTACQYANETFEKLSSLRKTSVALGLGRHPTTGFETLGPTGGTRRCYTVSQMPAPLDSVLEVDVRVYWQTSKPESILVSSYLYP